jgi:putative endonuclease
MAKNKNNYDGFWIYILECENGNYYTGYTKDLAKRYQQHVRGTANSKYTRSFKPKRIAQCWQLFDEVGMALKIERFIKGQDRKVKQSLIENPADLKAMIAENLNLNLSLLDFDPTRIETELSNAKLDKSELK